MKNHYTFFILSILLLFSCSNEEEIVSPINTTVDNISFYGIVIDENNAPIEGATATFNDQNVTTDQNGYFEFNNISINSDRIYIRIHKNGYFHGSKAFTPSENGRYKINIQLLSNNTIETFNSANSHTVQFDNGASIEFPKDAFVGEVTGITYTGPVYIAAKSIHTETDIANKTPGDYLGVDNSGQINGISPFSIAAIELFAANGDKLQLAEGKEASIRFPITKPQTSLENEIPLGVFNQQTGYWEEAGKATLQNGMYVATVSHFSFWGCYIPSVRVKIIGSILDSDNNAMKYTKVSIKAQSTNDIRYGYTNQHGILNANVPKGENLILEVFDFCGDILVSNDLGYIDNNTNLGEIIVDKSQLNTISGNLVTCDTTPVESGYLNIFIGDSQTLIALEGDGSFEYNFNACNLNSIKLQGVNSTNGQTSPLLDFTLSQWLDVGSIKTCETPSNFIAYTINNNTTIVHTRAWALNIGNTTDSNDLTSTLLYATSDDGSIETFFLPIQALETGIFPVENWFHFGDIQPDEASLSNNTIEVTFLEYGAIGEHVVGSFKGIFIDTDGQNTSIEGDFDIILREQ